MNFKRNFFVITTALVGALALTGCDLMGSKFTHYVFINEITDKHENEEFKGYIKYGDYSACEAKNLSGEKVELGTKAQEVLRDHGGSRNIPSEGEQKIIVVPVSFSDYGVDKLNLTQKQYIENLNKAFFGTTKNNEYVSVGEYFNKSSYGKLKLDGKVCDKVFEFPLSVEDIEEKIKDKKLKRESLATEYYGEVLKWYKSNYTDLKDYEIEGLPSGKNVPIYMVYTYPSQTKTDKDTENFFWAYTFTETPLSWSSYSFCVTQNNGEPDAHTYIHETGHLLGLMDYYPTVASGKADEVVFEPTRRIDMMDCSIGDETSFSKMFLNWTRPYYITDSCSISIRSFTDTGDVILLANDWNKTVFDEYYLIEFYTPTGLNTYDVSVGNNLARLPNLPGIKVYHVDARLAYLSASKSPEHYCSDGGDNPGTNNVGFAHDNNTYPNEEKFSKNYLYELIMKEVKDSKTAYATDANLFRMGDEIPALNFNKGGYFQYKITVESLQFSKATIKFEKQQ